MASHEGAKARRDMTTLQQVRLQIRLISAQVMKLPVWTDIRHVELWSQPSSGEKKCAIDDETRPLLLAFVALLAGMWKFDSITFEAGSKPVPLQRIV